MRKTLLLLFFLLQGICWAKPTQESLLPVAPSLLMNPPKGWECIQDASQLPEKVKSIFIGSGKKSSFTPSINIAFENTELPIDTYVATAKSYHESQAETRCSILGTIQTKAGPLRLMQIDRPTQWGDIRFLQAILVVKSNAYIITATCLREDFPTISPQFFKSIQSITMKD